MENKETEERKQQIKKSANAYMKYTGMAFQIGGVILVGVLIGRKLDQYFETTRPLWTAGLALFCTIGAIYVTIKDEL
ncbi:MAG: AtpZ/AtpI family protein [Bacteroidota bacterium]